MSTAAAATAVLLPLLLLSCSLPPSGMGVHISPTDLGAARTWAARHLNCTSGVTTGQLPFCFRLGGEPSAKLLLRWKLQTSTDGNSTLCSFTDPGGSGLVARMNATVFENSVEWVVSLHNAAGSADSAALSRVLGADLRFQAGTAAFELYHSLAYGEGVPTDYMPQSTRLGCQPGCTCAAAAGRQDGTHATCGCVNPANPPGPHMQQSTPTVDHLPLGTNGGRSSSGSTICPPYDGPLGNENNGSLPFFMSSSMAFIYDWADNSTAASWWGTLRGWLQQYEAVRPLYDGDFYQLTPLSLSTFDWIAWQLHRAELGHGMLQIFRRSNSSLGSVSFPVFGLEPTALYSVTDWAGGRTLHPPRSSKTMVPSGSDPTQQINGKELQRSGQSLRTKGLVIYLPPPPAACMMANASAAGWTASACGSSTVVEIRRVKSDDDAITCVSGVNVRAWGAKGESVTDHSAAFTTALPRADNMSIGAPLEPMQKGTDGLSFSRRFVNADVNVSCVAPRGASLIKWKTDDHTGRPSVLFCGRGLRPQFGGPDLDYLVELHEKVSSVFSCVVHLIVFVASQALSFVLS